MKRFAALLVAPALTLAGCQQEQARTSIDLLRAGNAGICSAADVEDSVRRLIYPDGITREGYTIAFADASLEAFDQVVSRATCNAALTIDGPDGAVVERTMIDFAVVPSAQNPAHFIVSGAFSAFTVRIKEAVDTAATMRAEQEEAKQAQEALVALVKPGWLIGRWVPASAGSTACVDGPFDDFGPKGRLTTSDTNGRWSLAGLEIKFVTPANSATITIADATMDEFTIENADGRHDTYRRCTRDEVRPDSVADPDVLADQLEALANDLEGPSE